MFRYEPNEVCMQHTGRRESRLEALIEMLASIPPQKD